MIKKILFLVESPFCQRDYDRFGIELLQANGFDVEVWDLTDILHRKFSQQYTPPDPINWSGCQVFKDKKVVLNKIRSLTSDTFLINLIGYIPASYNIYRSISMSQAQYAVFMAGVVPPYKESAGKRIISSLLNKLRGVINKKAPGKVYNYALHLIRQVFYRLPYAWIGIKPANIILAGGEDCLVYRYPIDKNTEILWAHTLDYDLYLKEKNTPAAEQAIAVFLDEYFPFHSYYQYTGIQPPITADKYYPMLNKFFSSIERQLGLKVIIAVHPRSQYDKHPDYFEGREWVMGKTVQLIKECKLVLAHSSTSVNFANLFHKPVIFLNSVDLDKSFFGPYIRAMADWFGHKPVFMDRELNIDWIKELTVDGAQYRRYRQAYIKTERSEDIPFWQIVANRLKKM